MSKHGSAFRIKEKERLLKYREANPWSRKYWSSKTNARRRGLEHHLKMADLKELWFRDKAWLLKEPSIDRIDNTKGYLKENCRFIESKENLGRNSRFRTPSARSISAFYENVRQRIEENKKIPDRERPAIMQRYRNGETQKALAAEYGVTSQAIWYVCHTKVVSERRLAKREARKISHV